MLCKIGRHKKKVDVTAGDINATVVSCARNCGWPGTLKYHGSEDVSGKG